MVSEIITGVPKDPLDFQTVKKPGLNRVKA